MERVRSDVAAVKEMLRQLDERSQRDSHYLRMAQSSLDLLVSASTAQLARPLAGGSPPIPLSGDSRLYGVHKWLTSGVLTAIISAAASAVINSDMLRQHGPAVLGFAVFLLLLLAVTNYFKSAS